MLLRLFTEYGRRWINISKQQITIISTYVQVYPFWIYEISVLSAVLYDAWLPKAATIEQEGLFCRLTGVGLLVLPMFRQHR